jgi:DNA-binding XRE family transcriptional regulator
MEALMKVDPCLIKQLREAKAWSQDHLAQVAGLSLRTIQRTEADGTASSETKMSIASAFGVAAEALTPKPSAGGAWWGAAFGLTAITVGAALACLGVATGHNTAFESGAAYGAIGLLSGLSSAVIGTVFHRYLCRDRSDA